MNTQLKTKNLKVKPTVSAKPDTFGIKKSKLEEIIQTLLWNRNIKTKKQEREFFDAPNPQEYSEKDLGVNPGQLKRAVSRIKKAIKGKEKIIIYGDYDVDGICAAAILWETIYGLGGSCLPYIPSRFTEGYGLNVESIKKLKGEDSEIKLIITVDNGITANEKIDFAKKLGIDVIITDHHQPGEVKPKAYAIVHTTKISGAAVAWVLSRKLESWNVGMLDKSNASNASNFQDHLGLAALGTVADVLSLLGHNRSFVKHGLGVLRNTNRLGIKYLCSEAGIDQKEIDTYHIGFIIAPRLNSAGRLEHAMDSLRMLCTKSPQKARELAIKLGRTNRTRQEKTEAILTHIEENFEERWRKNLPPVLFAHHESYEEGVVGIVAGRITEKYYRPTIVVAKKEEISKASARSIRGVNIVELIQKAGEGFLLSSGGHPMAAGLTIETKNIKLFHRNLLKYSAQISTQTFKRQTRVDCEIDLDDVSDELCEELSKFAPFGFGNPEPVFLTKEVYVEDVRLVGRDKQHIKMRLTQQPNNPVPQRPIGAIGFGMGELFSQLSPDRPVDVVYNLTFNEWNGNRTLQLKVKEIQ